MTPQKIESAALQMAAAIQVEFGKASRVQAIRQNPDQPGTTPQHLLWMCEEIPHQVRRGDIGKANRWLGFVQGAIVAWRRVTISDMKATNMPEPNPEPID